MQIPIEQIIEGALALPPEARALLADRLTESLDPSEEGELHQLWVEEVDRRLNGIRSGRSTPIPADEALARVRRAIGA